MFGIYYQAGSCHGLGSCKDFDLLNPFQKQRTCCEKQRTPCEKQRTCCEKQGTCCEKQRTRCEK